MRSKKYIPQVIKETTGKSTKQFVTEELNSSLQAFSYRLSSDNGLKTQELIYLSLRTGISIHDLIFNDPANQEVIARVRNDIQKYGEVREIKNQHQEDHQNIFFEIKEESPKQSESFKVKPL